jgi:hypothetical protein
MDDRDPGRRTPGETRPVSVAHLILAGNGKRGGPPRMNTDRTDKHPPIQRDEPVRCPCNVAQKLQRREIKGRR